MEGIVTDVSSCVPWCCADEASETSERLLALASSLYPIYVPSLWPWEMMSAISSAVRRGRVSSIRAVEFSEDLATFDFHVAPATLPTAMVSLYEFAKRVQLTPYDASYLLWAKELAMPLATFDAAIRRAAQLEGVKVFA